MAVTANQLITRSDECRKSYPVAASTYIYEGTLCFINANGYLDDDTASGVNKFAGVAIRAVDNSSGSNGDLQCEVFTEGVFLLTGAGTYSQADVGKSVLATDNYTIVVADSATAVGIGVAVEYVSTTTLMVRLNTYKPFQAAAMTTALTTLTPADAAGTPDYAIAAVTNSSPYGFSNAAEAITILYVIKNLQTRVNEVEAILQSNGFVD